jgi:hypothetical protein
MAKVLETRKIVIIGRVLTLTDVRALASLLERESKALPPDNIYRPNLSFHAKCSDGSSFRSSDIELFSDDSVIARKRVESISMKLGYYPTESEIDIYLQNSEHSSYLDRNYANVEGSDSKWVNGNLNAIEEIIESCTPQKPFVLQHTWLVHTVLALGMGRIYYYLTYPLVGLLSFGTTPPAWATRVSLFFNGHQLAAYALVYLSNYFVGFFPASYFLDKLRSLWPDVELQIGPEHFLVEKRRRRWLLNFLLLGVIPLATSLVYDLLRPFFLRP